ncbi:acyl-CoA-binding protein homolog [Macrosteles quadrilineatus]|uniref:acyl-CoA-binding protein homolog n=1 Tax=Macrosteles quadrilineatus TaxID=74068 RepID=UPI0023E314ED|nr:acyl-CoA-binding protein homolog [Macrosteles quadrilineatus]
MSLSEQFDKAAKDVNNLKETPPQDDLLEIYGLYKQATTGDCCTDRPGIFDQKGRYKWDAWNGRKGMSQDEAKKAYIAKVEALAASIGLK